MSIQLKDLVVYCDLLYVMPLCMIVTIRHGSEYQGN